MKRWLVRIALTLAVLGIAGASALGWMGYFRDDPVTLYPAAQRRSTAKIVFLSGDMGLKTGLNPAITRGLSERGWPVLGFNSMTWFRQHRSRAEVERLIPDLMARADAAFGPGPTVLIGKSFGADALQLALARLPQSERSRVPLVVLIVPTDTIYLKVSLGETLEWSPPDLPALPSARQLGWAPVLCIYGEQETRSLCPSLRGPGITRRPLPGGHFLNRDAAPPLREIVAALERVHGAEQPARR